MGILRILHLQKNKEEVGWLDSISTWLIFLLIILIPLTHKENFSIIDNDLVLSKFVLVAVALLGFITIVSNTKDYVYDHFFLLLISLFTITLISIIPSMDKANTLRIIFYQLAILLAYPVIRRHIAIQKGNITYLYWLINSAVTITLVYLLVQVFNYNLRGEEMGGIWPSFGVATRYGSTFWDVNHYGVYLATFILFSLGYIKEFASDKSKSLNRLQIYYFYGVVSCSFIAVYLTRSRSSMLALLAGLIVFFSIKYNIINKITKLSSQWFIYLIGLLVPFGVISFLYVFARQIMETLFFRAYSTYAHIYLYKTGLGMWIEKPFFGIGANSFHANLINSNWKEIFYFIDPIDQSKKVPLHSIWLESLTETGVFAFIVFSIFWLLILVSLYKRYRSANDMIALGLFSGIVAFLIGGVMYSYKSEFYWIYILISISYVYYYEFGKNLKYRSITWSSIKSYYNMLKNYYTFGNISIPQAIVFIISCLVLFIPLFKLNQPLEIYEIRTFYADFGRSIIAVSYKYLLDLFRFIFGNYLYTGRLLSLVFYLGSVLLLWNIFRRYLSNILAFYSVAVFFALLNIFSLITEVSMLGYVLFIILVLVGGVMLLLNKIRPIKKISIKSNSKLFVGISVFLVLSLSISILLNRDKEIEDSLSSDLTTLAELAYNKRLFDEAAIWVESSIEPEVIYYFCDKIDLVDNKFVLEECRINDAAFYVGYADFLEKNIFISDSEYYLERLPGFIESKGSVIESDLIELGSYYIIKHNPKDNL